MGRYIVTQNFGCTHVVTEINVSKNLNSNIHQKVQICATAYAIIAKHANL